MEPVHSSCSYHAARTTGHKLRASAVFFSTPCADVRLDSLCTPLCPHGLKAFKVQTISARVCVAPHNREGVRSAPLDTDTDTHSTHSAHNISAHLHMRLFAVIRREAGRQGVREVRLLRHQQPESAAVQAPPRLSFSDTGESAAEAPPPCFGAPTPILRRWCLIALLGFRRR